MSISDTTWQSMSLTRWGRAGQALAVCLVCATVVAALGLLALGIKAAYNNESYRATIVDGLTNHPGVYFSLTALGAMFGGSAIFHISKENPTIAEHNRRDSTSSESDIPKEYDSALDDEDTFQEDIKEDI